MPSIDIENLGNMEDKDTFNINMDSQLIVPPKVELAAIIEVDEVTEDNDEHDEITDAIKR